MLIGSTDQFAGTPSRLTNASQPNAPALCPHGGRVEGVQLIGGTAQYTAGVEQFVARLAQQHLSLMNEGDLVRDFVQIARDVAGQQDRVIFVLHEVVQQIEHLIPHDRVKAARRLVKQQQLASCDSAAATFSLVFMPLE